MKPLRCLHRLHRLHRVSCIALVDFANAHALTLALTLGLGIKFEFELELRPINKLKMQILIDWTSFGLSSDAWRVTVAPRTDMKVVPRPHR